MAQPMAQPGEEGAGEGFPRRNKPDMSIGRRGRTLARASLKESRNDRDRAVLNTERRP